MSKNTKPHNRFFPYQLETSNVIYGCYTKLSVATKIGIALGGYWRIRNLKDAIVADGVLMINETKHSENQALRDSLSDMTSEAISYSEELAVLKAKVKELSAAWQSNNLEMSRLRESNAELVSVLKEAVDNNMLVEGSEWWGRVDTAIAKASKAQS